MYFLIITTEKVSITSPMKVRANVQEPLYQGGVLSNTTHVKNVLPVILLGQVDVVE